MAFNRISTRLNDGKILLLLFLYFVFSFVVFWSVIASGHDPFANWTRVSDPVLNFLINVVVVLLTIVVAGGLLVGWIFVIPVSILMIPVVIVVAVASSSLTGGIVVATVFGIAAWTLRAQIAEQWWHFVDSPIGSAMVLTVAGLLEKSANTRKHAAARPTVRGPVPPHRNSPASQWGEVPMPKPKAETADENPADQGLRHTVDRRMMPAAVGEPDLESEEAARRFYASRRMPAVRSDVEARRGISALWETTVQRANLKGLQRENETILTLRDQQLSSRDQDIRFIKQDSETVRAFQEYNRTDDEGVYEAKRLKRLIAEEDNLLRKAEGQTVGGGGSTLEQIDAFLRDIYEELPPAQRTAFVRGEGRATAIRVVDALEREFGKRIFDDPAIRQYLRERHINVDQVRPDRR